MEGPKHISFVIRHLYHIMDRNFGSGCCHSDGTTAYHGRIIGYLYARRDIDVFQRDIENHFGIRRSTVTKVLQAMESIGVKVERVDRHTVRINAKNVNVIEVPERRRSKRK